MIAEILLIVFLLACGGVLVYLYQDHVKNVATREKIASEERERSRLNEAVKDQQRRERFRAIVLRELKAGGFASFRLDQVAIKCQVSMEFAIEAAKSIYVEFLKKVVSDDVVTPSEREQLGQLARGFRLPLEWVESTDKEVIQGHYKEKVKSVFADGKVTSSELFDLDIVRRSLGLSMEDASKTAVPDVRAAYLALLGAISDTGIVTDSDKAEIWRIKKVAGLEGKEIAQLIRLESLNLFRRCFATVVQDGILTKEEKELLAWFQSEVDLPNEQANHFLDQIRRAERFSELRQGNLVQARTKKLLEGGELCYYDDSCMIVVTTKRSENSIRGEILITNKRVAFVSDKKSFSFAPWKIIDVDTEGNRKVILKVDARTGSGEYFVGNAEEVEAILVGLAKKLKYSSAESYSSTLTRHIPPAVKREVWARDGGQCVQCSASDYLEFDHIIPHSQGGANTAGNVQILCRRCNGEKSDRI